MAVHTQVLEARLNQSHIAAQLHLGKQHAADASDTTALWRTLDDLDAELWRALKQFGSIESQREALLTSTVGNASSQGAQEQQSRAASVDGTVARMVGRAALLAACVCRLRRHANDASSIDLAQAVCRVGLQVGKTLDQNTVRRIVFETSAHPMLSPTTATRANADNPLMALFVVLAMVLVLVRGRSSH